MADQNRTHEVIRQCGGIVHSDGNIFFTNRYQFEHAASILFGVATVSIPVCSGDTHPLYPQIPRVQSFPLTEEQERFLSGGVGVRLKVEDVGNGWKRQTSVVDGVLGRPVYPDPQSLSAFDHVAFDRAILALSKEAGELRHHDGLRFACARLADHLRSILIARNAGGQACGAGQKQEGGK